MTIRITKNHLNTIHNKLNENHTKITELRAHVLKNFEWHELPKGEDGEVCAVDGSRMETRLCGGMVYAISANVIGKNVDRGMFEANILSDSSYSANDRIRRMMMTLEYRTGALVGDEVDILLIDGTLGGALIPPIFSSFNPLNGYHEEAVTAGKLFIDSLDGFYEEVLRNWDGDIYFNNLLAPKIFQNFEDEYSEYILELREFLNTNNLLNFDNILDWEVFFEYLELLHSFNRLLDYNCVFISKTFYTTLISDIIRKKGMSISSVLDAPLLNSVFPESGYLALDYDKKSRLHINNIYETFECEFPNICAIGVNSHKDIIRSYLRFVSGGNLWVLETLKGDKSLDNLISLIVPYSKSGYPIYLRDAHYRAVINKKEFDAYVSAIMRHSVMKNNDFGLFFQNGRDAL